MSDKKGKIMSLSIDADMQKLLKESAKKAGLNRSQLIRQLVEKHLNLLVNEGEEIPIILKVPSHLRGDTEGLKTWLAAKTEAIIKHLS